MLEIIGLLLLGAMFALLELSAPWLQRRRTSSLGANPMLEDAIALLLLTTGLIGGTIVFVQVVNTVESGDIAWSTLAVGAAVVGMPLIAGVARRLGRAAWHSHDGARMATGGKG